VTLNTYDPSGHFIDHRLVERRANQENISLRTGCFCNPGGGELALGISAEELSTCFVHHTERLALDEFRRCIDTKSTGAVRVSLGLVTTFADVYRVVQFAHHFLDQPAEDVATRAGW
jgi:molybdenum cofactor sulfurtransferase